jgi:hypothetical protein
VTLALVIVLVIAVVLYVAYPFFRPEQAASTRRRGHE